MKQLSGVAAALLVLAVAGMGLVSPASAAAPAEGTTVALTPADSGDLAAGEALRLTIAMTAGSTLPTPAATATVTVDPTRLVTRQALEGWFSGTTKSTIAAQTVATADVPAIGVGLGGGVDVSVPANALPFGAPGVYAVSVSVTSDGGDGAVIGTARTAVAWNLTGSAAVPIAIAVPLVVPAEETEFLTSAQLTQYTAPTGILTRELADVEDSPGRHRHRPPDPRLHPDPRKVDAAVRDRLARRAASAAQ